MSMGVTVAMTVMCMSKGCEAYNVDYEPQDADDEQFIQPCQLITFIKSVNCIKDNLNTNEPISNQYTLSINTRVGTDMRNMPFAKPESVSILAYP